MPVVSTDNFVEAYAKEQGKTYNEVFKDYMPIAVKLMANQALICQANNLDVIWDQTSTTVATRAKKIRMLPNYYKIAVVFKTPVQPYAIVADRNVNESVMRWIDRNGSEELVRVAATFDSLPETFCEHDRVYHPRDGGLEH